MSWQVVGPWWTGESAPAAPDGLLTCVCGLPPFDDIPECGGIGMVDPDSGKTYGTPGQPMLNFTRVGTVTTEDGKWWASGRDGTTGQWTISVSADGGRTWSTSDMGLADLPSVDGWSVVERNGVIYATASTPGKLLGVWRSIDDGRSWTRTWTHDADHSLPGVVGTPIAAGDGSLILVYGTSTYVSTDHGHTFARTGDELTGTVTWTRAGYLRSGASGYALSSDGLRWREFTVR